MIFFRNADIILATKFLWAGLVMGVVAVILKTIAKVFRKNVYLVNLFSFIFWIAFGGIFSVLCFELNCYSYSGIGLVSMVLGLLIIRISVEFFFDYFVRFIYNEFSLLKRKHKNGKLQTNKKV